MIHSSPVDAQTSSIAHVLRGAYRRAFTLVEVLVTIAIMAVLFALTLPSLEGIFEVEQKAAVRELGTTYTWLMDEAALRNVTFRVVYNLDQNTWKVEVGDPDTMVFGSPDERQKWEDEQAEARAALTDSELEELGESAVVLDNESTDSMDSDFDGLSDSIFTTANALPAGIRFDYVYTPQYGPDGIFPNTELPEDESDQAIAYSYIFPNGTAEHTIVRIVNDDGEDGQSIEISPLDGRIRLTNEIIDPEELFEWIPEEAPKIQ